MITLFVGDQTSDLANAALLHDDSASLIDHSNYDSTRMLGTYYTSIADLPSLEEFNNILLSANTIVYSPPNVWSDDNVGFGGLKFWTEFYCLVYSKFKEVIGLDQIDDPHDLDTMLHLNGSRCSNNQQLWVFGDSITFGIGVTDEQRYAEILSKQLDLPLSVLAQPATSILWAADQILRSDIKKDDIVVWGLTNVQRFPFMDDNSNYIHVTTGHYVRDPSFQKTLDIDVLSHFKNYQLHCVRSVYEVFNYCNKIGAQLFVAGLIVDIELVHYLGKLDCYYHLAGIPRNDLGNRGYEFLDVGSDNEHPGPLTHQHYADTLFEVITK
jgi:hypothetical protein